jgi:L-threonylcarbamoyladenylate synthase
MRSAPASALARALPEAVERLRREGLVAYPTETVWGLGACARSEPAVRRLREWKGRAGDQPLSLLVADLPDLARMGLELAPRARALAERFWPGPLTLVVPGTGRLAAGVARADGAVGLRCSAHPVAAALARAAAEAGLGPITSTSLNRSGEPPARTRAEAQALCAGGDPWLLGVGESGGGEPSTVVDLTGAEPRVLRRGALAPGALGEEAA